VSAGVTRLGMGMGMVERCGSGGGRGLVDLLIESHGWGDRRLGTMPLSGGTNKY
jgi:hypothetical protein